MTHDMHYLRRPKASVLSGLTCALTCSLLVPRLWHRSWGCNVDVAALNLFRGVLCELSEVPTHAVQVLNPLSHLGAY